MISFYWILNKYGESEKTKVKKNLFLFFEKMMKYIEQKTTISSSKLKLFLLIITLCIIICLIVIISMFILINQQLLSQSIGK